MLNFDLKVLDSINQLICTFELTTARLGPGRYCSRFRVCAAFVELHYLIPTKLNQNFNLSLLLKAAN